MKLVEISHFNNSLRWFSDMNIPFSQWTREQVCGWLEDYGLGQYINLARQWVENGQTILSATPQDFEKVLMQNIFTNFLKTLLGVCG